MIRKYTYGNPIDTEAVVVAVPEGEKIPYFTVDAARGSFIFNMEEKTAVYGLGETVRGINKRGWTYTGFNTDETCHDEGKHSLYCTHNFIVVSTEGKSFGAYFDFPTKIVYDIGYTDCDVMEITPDTFDVTVYIIDGESIKDIVSQFRAIIGKPYLPPKWAFGYGQCRWSYMDEDEIRSVADGYQKLDIPIDMIYMDIDYMERYKDFTINDTTFAKFPEFVSEMKDRGIHLVPIIDAGVKKEEGYDVYDEGVKNNYFVKKADGSDYVIAVWPGLAVYPDYLNPEVRKWFGDKYKVLTEAGIEGFWNDMNEPAIFYSEDHIAEVIEKIGTYKGKNMDTATFEEFKAVIKDIENSPSYLQSFYHNYHGQNLVHYKVHNLFGYNMSRAAGEGFARNYPDKRFLMISRSSFIGMHRYSGIWFGDNRAWWSHLLLNVKQMASINMCGFLYTGADMGGFGDDTTEDLVMRWVQLSMFTPLMRNHSALGTRRQELYRFKHTDDFRNMINLRYSLVPYLYTSYMKAYENDGLMFSPLAFEYENDERAKKVEDQLLVGDSIMIAPVCEQNAVGRYVYLPEDMKLVRFRAYDDYDTEVLSAGDHYVPCALNEVLVFVRKGKALPLVKPAECVDKLDLNTVKYIGFENDGPADLIWD